MRKKTLVFVMGMLLMAIYTIKYIQDTPVTSYTKPETINLLKGPIQTPVSSDDFLYEENKFEGSIIDYYKINAKVLIVTVNDEYIDEHKSPIDIGLVWGEVADSDYDQYIKYKHVPKYSFTKTAQTLIIDYKGDLPSGWTTKYIIGHITNNHIFPANENIYKVLAGLKKKQKVILGGYVLSPNAETIAEIESHTGHYNPDDYPCKNFYVKKVQVGDKVYE